MREFLRGIRSVLRLGEPGTGISTEALPPLDERARACGVTDQRVLAAMARVPRAEFMAEELRAQSRVDNAFAIGEGQTISQPSLVARMTEKLGLASSDNVLEIGAGSGYQAAILSVLARRVHAVEIIPSLAQAAAKRLARLGFGNVWIHVGDGFEGWAREAPYDAVMVSCAVPEIPAPLLAQLKEGGRMILPLGGSQLGQKLILLSKLAGGEVRREELLLVQFVPLTGPHGAQAEGGR